MSVAIKKVSGVESVTTSLNEGYVDIHLRQGNTATVEQVREVVRKNGFSPKEATVQVRGTVVERDGKPALDAGGPSGVLLLTGNVAHLSHKTGQRMVVRGTLPARGGKDAMARDDPDTLQVQEVSSEGR